MAKTKQNPTKKKSNAKTSGGIGLIKGKGSNAVRGNTGGNTSNQTKVKPVKQKAARKTK
jgi:hypothetical protein